MISVFVNVIEVSDVFFGFFVSIFLMFDDSLYSLYICEVGVFSVVYVFIDYKYLVIYENKIILKGYKWMM